MPPEKPHWAELFNEVVTSGLCTGCAGCVVACPYDVLSYDDTGGRTSRSTSTPRAGPTSCTHGVKGCTMCTRACPRFRLWETEIDTHLFGRERTDEEVAGVSSGHPPGPGHRSRDPRRWARTAAWSRPC